MYQYRIINFGSVGRNAAKIVCSAALDLDFYDMNLCIGADAGIYGPHIESDQLIPFNVIRYFEERGISLRRLQEKSRPQKRMKQGSLFE